MCRIHRLVASLHFAAAGIAAAVLWASAPARAAELVMFEQQGCEWCEIWHEQIGAVYPKTEEGRRAPLRQLNIHEPMPADLAHIRSDRFTPTFVLVENGEEIGRIRGYPGEDFFWGLLGQMMAGLDGERKAADAAPDKGALQQ